MSLRFQLPNGPDGLPVKIPGRFWSSGPERPGFASRDHATPRNAIFSIDSADTSPLVRSDSTRGVGRKKVHSESGCLLLPPVLVECLLVFGRDMLKNHQNEALFKMPKVQVLDGILSASEHEDGHFNRCKSCVCRGKRANYRCRREYYRQYERKRAQEPTRRAYQVKLNRRYRRRRQKQAGK